MGTDYPETATEAVLGMGQVPMNRSLQQPPTAANHSVIIRKVLNGFHVHVGCQEVVFETQSKMISELDRYFKDPAAVQKEYLEKR